MIRVPFYSLSYSFWNVFSSALHINLTYTFFIWKHDFKKHEAQIQVKLRDI